MKRITILLVLIVFATITFAQKLRAPVKKAEWGRESGAMAVIERDISGTKIYGDTIWSNDLSNPDDWEIWNDYGDDQDWEITTDPNPPLYRIGRIQSTTWGNGYALFNSDGIGAVGDPYQRGSIGIKDPVDLTGYDNVAIRFQQSYMKWEDIVYVGISLDDGANWTDFEINDLEVKVQTYEDIVLNISSVAANQPQVWFRFFFEGDWDYGWMIDDVAIIEGAYDELRINQVFARCVFDDSTNMGIHTYIPDNQVVDENDQSKMYYDTLGVAIFGDGLNTQHNISFTTDVTPEGGSSIFNQTGATVDSLIPFTKDTMYMQVTAGDLYMPETADIYNFDYVLSQDETDEAPETNLDTYTLIVNDSVFARDRELTGSSGPDHYTTGGVGDGVGVVFWIPNADTVASLSMWIHDDTDPGTTIIGKLYYWDGTNQITVLKIETEEYIVQPWDIRNWVTIPFISFGDDEEFIEGGHQYIAMAHLYYEDGSTRLHLGGDGSAIHYFNNSATAFLEGVNEYDSYSTVIPFIRLNLGPCCWEQEIMGITWSDDTFVEAIENDGSISNTIDLQLVNETFTVPTGEMTEGTHFSVLNVPVGLNVVITGTTSASATIELNGNATDHANSNDIYDLTITFLDAAFSGGNAGSINDNSQILRVDFINAECDWNNNVFSEATDNDGSISTVIDVTLTYDTFVISGAEMTEGTHFSVLNVPGDLAVVLTGTGSNTATVALSGNATDHADSNDVSDMVITFLDAALTGGDAVNVVNNPKTFSIDFIDPYPAALDWSNNVFSEAIENDGSISTVIDLTLAYETFAVSGAEMTEGTHFSTLNVPDSLTVVITGTGSNTATVGLSGNATDHADSNDVSDMVITFLDTAFTGGNAVDVVNNPNTFSIDFIVAIADVHSQVIMISQNYPNPFKNNTEINYELNVPEDITLIITDITGKKIMEIHEGKKTQGAHTINISAENLESGVYYYTIHAGDLTTTKKMVVIK